MTLTSHSPRASEREQQGPPTRRPRHPLARSRPPGRPIGLHSAQPSCLAMPAATELARRCRYRLGGSEGHRSPAKTPDSPSERIGAQCAGNTCGLWLAGHEEDGGNIFPCRSQKTQTYNGACDTSLEPLSKLQVSDSLFREAGRSNTVKV